MELTELFFRFSRQTTKRGVDDQGDARFNSARRT
jgi:hypothetical protein